MKKMLVLVLLVTVAVGCSGSGGKKQISQDGTLDSNAETVAGEDVVAGEDMVAGEDVPENDIPAAEDVPVANDLEPLEDIQPVEDIQPMEDVQPSEDVEPMEDVEPEEDLFEPDVSIPDLPKDGDDCYTIVLCGLTKGCDDISDDACWGSCYTDASEMALWDLALVQDCYADNCSELGPDQEAGSCLWEMCGLALYVCVGGEGEADCGETVNCQLECPEDDGLCPLQCMKQADQNAVEGALELLYADTDNAFWAWMFECVGGQGEMTCGEMGICLQDCGMMSDDEEEQMDMACVLDCVGNSTEEAMDTWLDIFSCGEDPCFDKLIECIGGQGDLSCGETFMCMGECEENQEGGGDCFTQCMSQTSEEGAADILELLTCAEEKCPEGMDECPGMFECMALCPGMGFPGPG